MRLYVVRHGETLENANNCLVGRLNSSLTNEGINQAKKVSEYFKDKNIDLIVSSPLDRCRQTSEIISNKKAISDYIIDNEISQSTLDSLRKFILELK